ncbi:hypothetical protein AZE42_07698 [Rhizopogon vesiculosus]|uniref:JmjC domain-containing protein n=1 Tax=Rhizopogon vesiculosus TaxID=180088 RepID=A0A1J8Q2R0_9AGAM|nr:hypothetical protein AZE42_07698 [Rhizopogon vesiculosus]
MNTIQDSHKRTSISQLLNPSSDSSVYSHAPHLPSPVAVSQYQHAQHQSQANYNQSIEPESTFHLREASWEPSEDRSAPKRRVDNVPGPGRPYQLPPHPHMHAEPNGDMVHRQGRSRMDEPGNYGMAPNSWPSQADMSNPSYGSSVVAPMYSDERTALSGDYPANTQYNHPSQNFHPQPQQLQGHHNSSLQHAERASVRIAARFTAPLPGQPMFEVPMHHPAGIFLYHAHAPAPIPPQKRPSTEEGESAPKTKKAKTKAKTTEGNGSSKRGYNARKRSEAAQIAAQNAQLMPTVSYASAPADKGKEKTAESTMRIVTGDQGQNADSATQLHPELQFARTIAHALLPTLRQELQHLNYPEIIRRTRESEVRATCDTCMTSIFSSSWMCRLCGREACAECFEQVKDLTEDRPGATQSEIASLQARRDKHAHSNPFFLSCTRRNEHHAKDFSPMSRFCKAELAQAIKDMEAMLKEPDVDALPDVGAIDPSLQAEQSNGTALGDGSSLIQATDSQTGGEKSAPVAEPSAPSNGPSQVGIPHPESAPVLAPSVSQVVEPLQSAPAVPPSTDHPSSEIPSHHTLMIPDSQLTEEIFRPLWAKGEPIVVTELLPKFQLQWTPEYFVQKYNSQSCLILECQTDLNKRVTVGEFFSWFGKYEGRVECWKLKDWPPSTDFKTAFPELFEDFSRAVPVPNYVRRDGALNIASHFPSNTVAPDLGPKMYNAMSSFESAGSKGSTRIHMDMADAVNIMTYASSSPDGKPGCAVWDLFRAQDAERLRHFLKKKFKGAFQHDPIHSQQFYLDSQLRKELYDTLGIKSHRVYQKPGEAIFIPAGCAHQVCNLADCIKVAVDFVSPENIDRCEKLTREFREQNQSMAWKEDVLQLRTMMWFAWLSCSRQEKEVED